MGVGVFCTGKRGWVGRENAFFFEKFYRGHDPPHPQRSPYTPPVETPAPSAPGTTAQRRQQRRPCQMQGRPPTTNSAPTHTPGRWTRCTGMHSIPDRPRRVDRGGAGGLDSLRGASETEQKWTLQNLKNKYAKKRKYLLTFTQESV